MKHIKKGNEPTSFTLWKKDNPDKTFDDFKKESTLNRNLKDALMSEQGYLCCYCECRISRNYSHIEHFKPKDKFPKLSLEYSNLFASCIKNPPKGEKNCGHKKDNYYSDTLISPLEKDCHTHFTYNFDGTIEADDERGEESIREYNLNSELLKKRRIEVIEELLKSNSKNKIKDHLDENHLQLGEFYTMIEYLFNNML